MSKTNILITGAGGGGSNNLIRSIRQSALKEQCFIVGTNMSPYPIAKSTANINYCIEAATKPGYLNSLNKIIKKHSIDLVIPNSDREVRKISENREMLDSKVFLPSKRTVRLCQDKKALSDLLRAHNLPSPQQETILSFETLNTTFRNVQEDNEYVWIRMRAGSGSKGSLPVKNPAQARSWIDYWVTNRDAKISDFLLCEYLPFKNYACQTLWKNGKLVMAKMCERIEYFFGHLMPSGSSSTPQVAKLMWEPSVFNVCKKAVKAVDNNANGNFCIDLKEDRQHIPNVTEINIGRFFMITNFFNLTGEWNMATLFIAHALGEGVYPEPPFEAPREDVYLLRDLDTEPLVLTKSEMRLRYYFVS